MNTYTRTYTRTDIQKVFERFNADLLMLAYRTQAMEIDLSSKICADILQMAYEECIERIDIQLLDIRGNLLRAHKYTIQRNRILNTHRPGGNNWPCLPSGSLDVIVFWSDLQRARKLKESGKLNLNWGPSNRLIEYNWMIKDNSRQYTSQNYGLERDSFRSKWN